MQLRRAWNRVVRVDELPNPALHLTAVPLAVSGRR
jgi:hypothetical protein